MICRISSSHTNSGAKGPEQPLSPASFQIVRISHVGNYAIQPAWADGHSSGLYAYDYLRKLG